MKKTIVFFVAFQLIAFISVLVYVHRQIPRLAYVDIVQVYENFEMKKELEAKFENTQQTQKNILDSLALSLKLLNNQLAAGKASLQETTLFETKKNDFLTRQEYFHEQVQNITDQYSKQIWNQLNEYMKSYGEANGYTIILGGNGTGNVMHANKGLDITQQALEYVNEKYKGK